jgi:hypothetical protein
MWLVKMHKLGVAVAIGIAIESPLDKGDLGVLKAISITKEICHIIM